MDTPSTASPATFLLKSKLVIAGIWWMDADMTMPETPMAIASCQNTLLFNACRVVIVTSRARALRRGAALPGCRPSATSAGSAPSGSMP